jgi:hypothetical protein
MHAKLWLVSKDPGGSSELYLVVLIDNLEHLTLIT